MEERRPLFDIIGTTIYHFWLWIGSVGQAICMWYSYPQQRDVTWQAFCRVSKQLYAAGMGEIRRINHLHSGVEFADCDNELTLNALDPEPREISCVGIGLRGSDNSLDTETNEADRDVGWALRHFGYEVRDAQHKNFLAVQVSNVNDEVENDTEHPINENVDTSVSDDADIQANADDNEDKPNGDVEESTNKRLTYAAVAVSLTIANENIGDSTISDENASADDPSLLDALESTQPPLKISDNREDDTSE